MKRTFLAVLTVFTLLFSASLQAIEVSFKVNAGVNVPGANDYFTAIQRYQGVTDRDVSFVEKHGIPQEEIPVVMFIASRANVKPEIIVNLRRQGRTWGDIALTYGLAADAFYVPVSGPVYGRVYGRLYSYYNRPMNMWRQIRLSDMDIVNFVNLRFMSDHYGYTPDEVIRMREEGKSFVAINREFYNNKDRRAHGWRDVNNVWHDRAKNFRPADKAWNQRETFWKNNDNRWHGNGDKAWQEKNNQQNYNDNKHWHGQYKEQDFNDNNNGGRGQGNMNNGHNPKDKNYNSQGQGDRGNNGRNHDDNAGNNDDRKGHNNGRNNHGNGNDNGKGKPAAEATEVPTNVPTQDNGANNGKHGHDNGQGNGYQNNGNGNMK